MKRVFFSGGGKTEAEGKDFAVDVLGKKGFGFAEMTSIGLPVPASFTIGIPACVEYFRLGRRLPEGLEQEVDEALFKLEKCVGKKLGDENDPLLVSVRSGAARSMPGMLKTILNLGLNDRSVEGLAARTNNPRFAYDSYRRFIQMFSTTAMGLSEEPMEEMLHALKRKIGIKFDPEIPADRLKDLCDQFKAYYRKEKGEEFPQDPMQQLWGAIMAVFNSWESENAVTYRRVEKINDLKGTAVNIVQMVFGNKGETSGMGVCFTRDPNSGENVLYGDCLINAQGEDLYDAAKHSPMKVTDLETRLPDAHRQLRDVCTRLEKHYRDIQDLEFTIDDGDFYLLQCRTGKRLPSAAVRIAVDMVKAGIITWAEALARVDLDATGKLLREHTFSRWIDESPAYGGVPVIEGLAAVRGLALGYLAFDKDVVDRLLQEGKRPILCVRDIVVSNYTWLQPCCGLISCYGGMTSRGAIHARSLGLPCVINENLRIDMGAGMLVSGGKRIPAGSPLCLDGNRGRVYLGHPNLPEEELAATIARDPLLSAVQAACEELRAHGG